jgi:hypothetical protein
MLLEAVSSSETLVIIYQTTRLNIVMYNYRRTRRRENLKFRSCEKGNEPLDSIQGGIFID